MSEWELLAWSVQFYFAHGALVAALGVVCTTVLLGLCWLAHGGGGASPLSRRGWEQASL